MSCTWMAGGCHYYGGKKHNRQTSWDNIYTQKTYVICAEKMYKRKGTYDLVWSLGGGACWRTDDSLLPSAQFFQLCHLPEEHPLGKHIGGFPTRCLVDVTRTNILKKEHMKTTNIWHHEQELVQLAIISKDASQKGAVCTTNTPWWGIKVCHPLRLKKTWCLEQRCPQPKRVAYSLSKSPQPINRTPPGACQMCPVATERECRSYFTWK